MRWTRSACISEALWYESLAVEKLHHHEGLAFVLADLVDGADVGVVERRGSARFAPEALQRLRIAGNVLGQELAPFRVQSGPWGESAQAARSGALGAPGGASGRAESAECSHPTVN